MSVNIRTAADKIKEVDSEKGQYQSTTCSSDTFLMNV